MFFFKEGGIVLFFILGFKSRFVYIIVDRIFKWKEIFGCKGCIGYSRVYIDECRVRFLMLVEKEKEVEKEKKVLLFISEIEVEDKDDEVYGIIFYGEDLFDFDSILFYFFVEDRVLVEEIFIRGEVLGLFEFSVLVEFVVFVFGVVIFF